jgi:hypothetical protein
MAPISAPCGCRNARNRVAEEEVKGQVMDTVLLEIEMADIQRRLEGGSRGITIVRSRYQ